MAIARFFGYTIRCDVPLPVLTDKKEFIYVQCDQTLLIGVKKHFKKNTVEQISMQAIKKGYLRDPQEDKGICPSCVLKINKAASGAVTKVKQDAE